MSGNPSSFYRAYSNSYNELERYYQSEVIQVTIRQFFEEYVEYTNDTNEFSKSYQRSINLTLRHFIKYFGDDRILSTLTEREYEKFFRNVKQTAPNGYLVYYRTLKAALSKAQKWKYINLNHLKDDVIRKKYKPIKKRPIFINKKDLEKILDAMADPELKRITLFAYFTGCRVSEIVNLKWISIDFENKNIRIGDTDYTPKDKEDREIPFFETVENILEEQKRVHGFRRQDFVFINQNNKKFRADNISKRFKEAVRKTDVNQSIVFHKLRASFITSLANNGVNIAVIQQLSGHNSLEAITPYLAYEQKHLREAVMKLE